MATIAEEAKEKSPTADETVRDWKSDVAAGEKTVVGSDGNKNKRGMKPRSQRNRKRPRSGLRTNDDLTFETEIRRLQLNGQPANGACPWIRLVKPYPYTFATFAKARWIGRSVLDVYFSEFGSYPKTYYKNAIQQGRILVSDQKVDETYLIKSGDVLTHTVHRHEPAVAVSSQEGIEVIEETPDLVVVNKPGTLPVHPCGGYHMNSLSHIMEPKFGKLYNINRLDRLTSGLVLLAKSSSMAQQLGKCLMQRDSCQKVYLARVRGKFPLKCPFEVNIMKQSVQGLPSKYGEWVREEVHDASDSDSAAANRKRAVRTADEMRNSNALGAWITDTSWNVQRSRSLHQLFESRHPIETGLDALMDSSGNESVLECDASCPTRPLLFHFACPTRVAKPKDGICEAGAFESLESSVYEKTVKPSQTVFSVVQYDSKTDSTILLCRPMTGRTHQIRLHLQFLGHPIANDPNYGGQLWYGDKEGHEVFLRAKSLLDDMNEANNEMVEQLQQAGAGRAVLSIKELPATCTDTPATEEELSALAHIQRANDEPLHDFIKRTCVWCARSRNEENGDARTILEYMVRSRGIWLHALAYHLVDASGRNINYCTSPPPWSVLDTNTDK